jgi:hypothetical protein
MRIGMPHDWRVSSRDETGISLHVGRGEGRVVRDAIAKVAPAVRASLAWPRDGWTSVHLGGGTEADALAVAAPLSRRLRCRTALLALAAGGRVRAWLHDGGAVRGTIDFDPDRGDAARCLAQVPPDFRPASARESGAASVLEHPAAQLLRCAEAAGLVERMREQVALEVAGNAEWLRRHAQVLGVEPPGSDDLDRGTELALMRRAHARLRDGAGDPRLEAARTEWAVMREAQQRAFHDLVSPHEELLDIAAVPEPDAAMPYFATVERALAQPEAEPTRMRSGPRPFVEELALRLGLDPSWHLRAPGREVPELARLPR